MQNLKKVSIIVGLLLVAMLIIVGCGGTTTETKTGEQETTGKTEVTKAAAMEGTIYLPGEGGHIAVAKVKVDPSNTDNPIEVTNLDRITLGAAATNATHDIRIDADGKTAYSAAIVQGSDGKIRIDKIDLSTMASTKEILVDPGKRYVGGPMYCASGQSEKYFMPVFMGYEGFIDVIDKATMTPKARVYFDDPQIGKNYVFAHGVSTPDNKYFLLSLNATSADKAGQMPPRGNPDFLLYKLDMAALEQGQLKIVKSGKIAADPATAIAFRQTFTSDGKYLLQSGRDRALVIDGETLELVTKVDVPKGEDGTQWENHDIIPTADNKYAIMTLRAPDKVEGVDKPVMDGKIMLFEIATGKIIGKPVSVCRACHEKMGSVKTKDSNLCGADVIWKK